MTGSVKLLNAWASMFGMRVIIALKEKGVEYEYQEEEDLINNKSKLLLESNPVHKKIPVLLHGGRPVCESLIIVHYIDETWEGQGSFLPGDPYERALARFWADFVDKKFYDAGTRILWSAEVEAREHGKEDFAESFATLDGALRDVFGGGAPFFGGHTLGLVDIAFAPYICWFPVYEALGGLQLPDQHRCPHLHAWVKRIVDHPSVKEAIRLAPPDRIISLLRPLLARAFPSRTSEAAES